MGQLYFIPFDGVAVTAAQDWFEIPAAGSRTRILHEIKITQSSDAGDAEAEMIGLALKRGNGHTSGSGGSTPTAQPLVTDQGSFGSTPEANNTTQASAGGGSLTLLFEIFDHVANGLHYLPAPEHRPVFKDDEAIIASLDDAPDDSLTCSGYMIVEEL